MSNKTFHHSITIILFRYVKFGNNIRKKTIEILHNSVALEIFLRFSIRLIFSPFQGFFMNRKLLFSVIKVLLSVTFFYPGYCSMIVNNFLQKFL